MSVVAALLAIALGSTSVAASPAITTIAATRAASAPPRFFFAGNGRLRLSHAHFAETLDVRYRRADGTYDPAALAQIRHFFRSREDGREAPITLRLIELLGYIQDRFHPRQMTLLSGYRSPAFNADLRATGQKAAQASLHTEGLAADVAFAGVDLQRLWRQLRQLQAGGAGYYRTGKFLHIDTGRPRFWEETTSRVDENLAAGNARMFLRTDFDRYTQLGGAILSLHSLTAFPLSIAPLAHLVGDDGTLPLPIEPLAGAAPGEPAPGKPCLMIPSYSPDYRFRITGTPEAPHPGRWRIVLSSCEPRIQQTPAEIESNTVELIRQ
jgi:uncharacterized protein YcbK (DUF882 family)